MFCNAKWIKSPVNTQSAPVNFVKNIELSGQIESATMSVTAMGIYSLYIDQEKIGKGVLTPGWTSYNHRLQYQTYDVKQALKKGSQIKVSVANGWAVGYIGFEGGKNYYADHTSLIAELVITYKDGKIERIITDQSWQVFSSKITYAELYHGETIDLTVEEKLIGNALLDDVKTTLIKQVGEWITEQEVLSPIALIKTRKGHTVIDFGQNLTGYIQLEITAKRGEKVVISHAEVLDKDGNFYNENYRDAKNILTFVCDGNKNIFKPTFSFQGFRYIRLDKYPFEQVELTNFKAIAVNSQMQRTGYFECGNPKINQLYHNVIWGQKGNYLDVPTDCPQRDERLGWTGDAQVFCRTGAINFDVEKFFTKWFDDLSLEQGEDGRVLGIVPHCVPGRAMRVSAGWGDAATIIPYQLYLAYGNKELLKKHFPVMKKWVNYQLSAGPKKYLWLGGNHYGDWLAMDCGVDSYKGATSDDLIASAFFAYSTSLVIKVGEILGEDVSFYKKLYKKVRRAFRKYFLKDGMPKEDLPVVVDKSVTNNSKINNTVHAKGVTQTALALLLRFNLVDDSERKAVVDKLVQLIKAFDNKMSTGFIGTPHILHALSENGYVDVAFDLLFQEENPSWLYSVNHGATTIWEHWNGVKEDGSFWSADMNSFNHYANGSVYDWIFNVACGISPVEENPAYKVINIHPNPDKRLGYVDAKIKSRNGDIRVRWQYATEKVNYKFDIPNGVTAKVKLPSGKQFTLGEGQSEIVE